jgi:hypothetical protein
LGEVDVRVVHYQLIVLNGGLKALESFIEQHTTRRLFAAETAERADGAQYRGRRLPPSNRNDFSREKNEVK